MKKSAQVVMLPTNEKAGPISIGNKSGIAEYHIFQHEKSGIYNNHTFQHLYILSDEEIKEGDWVYCLREGFEPVLKQKVNPIGVNNDKMFKKIIATTDSNLTIKTLLFVQGENKEIDVLLPQPSQSFLEKFVEEYNKGNVITEVMVEYNEPITEIPKPYKPYSEVEHLDSTLKVSKDNTIDINMPKDSWSREEVIELIQKYSKECTGWPWIETDEEWIEENL